jgi:predicted GNAT superfamily acetyltransferase
MLQTYLFKEIKELHHLQEAVKLQMETWGKEVISSLPQLVASIHNGGCVIGVFEDEHLIGFCYGFPGISETHPKPYLVSHMMAIHPDYRNQKLGEKLKFKQREWALNKGFDRMIWTFDPLEIKNGYLNLTKLGGHVKTYIKSYYGEMNDKLNKGTPSDRFLLEWELQSPVVMEASKGKKNTSPRWNNYPLYLDFSLNREIPHPGSIREVSNEIGVLVPVPKQIQRLKNTSPETAFNWRMEIRNAASKLLSNDYFLRGALLDTEIGYYVFEKSGVNVNESYKAMDKS